MTSGTAHPAQTQPHDTGMHLTTWIASMLGLFAAAIGTWIMLAPADGTINVFGYSWAASDLTETWGPWLLIVGGGVAGLGMAVAAIRDWQHDASRWLVGAEVVLSLVGATSLVLGIARLG